MKNYCFSLKLFLSSKVNKAVLIVTLLLFNLYSVYCFVEPSATTFSFLINSLRLAPMYFAMFLFLSYEFYAQIRVTNLNETLDEKTKAKLFKSFFFVMLTVITVFAVEIFIYDFAFYLKEGIHHPEYLLIMFITVILYIVLPVCLAILVSMVLYSYKRVVGYALLAITALLPTTVFERLAKVFKLYSPYEFFKLFPYLNFMPNHSFGVALFPYCWGKVFFFIFLTFSLIVLNEYHQKKKIPVIIMSMIMALFSVYIYLQPVSKVDMHESYQLSEMSYYRKMKEKVNIPGEFTVEKYEMNFKVRNQLNANVKVYVGNNKKSSYYFTLYHGYKLKRVLDEEGNDLQFEQNGDFITVLPDNPENEMFEFIYQGNNMTFYSNYQGVYLSGGFAYYPKPGHIKVYNSEYQNYNCIFDGNNTEYVVKVNQLFGKTYSNIDTSGNNVFEGKGNGITMYSGMLDEYENGKIRVIYPYLATDMLNSEYLKSETDTLMSSITNTDQFTVFSVPNMNNINYNPVFSDAFELVGLIGLDNRFSAASEELMSEVN